MTSLEQTIYQEVLRDHPAVVALRRNLHRHPEIGKEEFYTQAKIEEELDKIGLKHWRSAGTGVMAKLEGTKNGPVLPAEDGRPRCIVLRADTDALPVQEQHECDYKSEIPGRMHACGHDGHTASLIGAARVLAAHRDLFAGTILFAFQPGEEIGYGGYAMVGEGQVDEATRSFGFHTASELPVGKVVLMSGPNNASVDWFRITIKGLGAHVSKPNLGTDALYIASQIVVALQSLVTRMSSPMDNLLIGVGKLQAGTAYNVIADHAEMEGTVRSLDPELRTLTQERIGTLVQHTAAIYGAEGSVQWDDFTPVLVNDETAAKEAQKIAVSLFGAENVITSRKPSLSGDDMAVFINKVPGVYAYVGSYDPKLPESGRSHHHPCFDIGEDCMIVSAALTVCYTLAYMRGEV